ncbi:hypothetical protein FZO89_16555 [Luteimonas viscosa]|uniref:Uncharacterized protein n=1 Tax=Luteimonas viscosa TaxID=1132694 RepID=A0A5D4XGS0_9GAMM|nr:hypothetical protein [Luteimonas viscosa]TYT23827.1 hypothetical protein FZO89_16555 [Luteimonas viscosa]
MSGFLRRLSPRHADALRPAAPLRALATDRAAPMLATPEDPADVMDRDAVAPAAAHAVGIETPSRPTATNASSRNPVTGPAHVMSVAPGPSVDASAPGQWVEPVRAAPTGFRAPGFDAVTNGSAHERTAIEAHTGSALPRPPAPTAFPRMSDSAPRAPLSSSIDVRPQAHAPPPLSASTVARLETASATSTPPTIHLHIDRIEVRAAARPAAAPPTRPRARPEPQSLHDYLHGKRRG